MPLMPEAVSGFDELLCSDTNERMAAGEGWVRGTFDATKPRLALTTPQEGEYIHTNRDDAARK